MRLKTLILGYVLHTHIMDVGCLENSLRAPKGQEFTFFDLVHSIEQNLKIFRSPKTKKKDFGGQNDFF